MEFVYKGYRVHLERDRDNDAAAVLVVVGAEWMHIVLHVWQLKISLLPLKRTLDATISIDVVYFSNIRAYQTSVD